MAWLKLESGELVNLDHIAAVEILDMTTRKSHGEENCHVSLYPAEPEAEPFKACEGTRSKCEDYLRALMEWVEGKEICAVGEHRCGCECGCQAMIREDFKVCDECSADYHQQDYEEHLAELKNKALSLSHFLGLEPLIKKDAA